MEKQNLSALFHGKIFRIPEYQRGYAWEKPQLYDLIEDIGSLVDEEKIKFHYTGTIVTFSDQETSEYDGEVVEVCEVVDGQQRLTSVILYLSVILRALLQKNKPNHKRYERDTIKYLYDECHTYRLKLNNETQGLFTALLEKGKTDNVNESDSTPHQKRLVKAVDKFTEHVASHDVNTLEKLYEAITSKLAFTYYTIEEESEVGMTFELMNARGKALSILELVKNYFMHWVNRNGGDEKERLTKKVNKVWSTVYNNIGRIPGNLGSEDQCLRVAWTLYCSWRPRDWKGYVGFKEHIQLRVSGDEQKKAKIRFEEFIEGLSTVSDHYCIVVSPCDKFRRQLIDGEEKWLTKIHNTRHIANFLPLMIATRIRCVDPDSPESKIESSDYAKVLKALECFIFRVSLFRASLFKGTSSTFAQPKFYWLAGCLCGNWIPVDGIVNHVYGLICRYLSEEVFRGNMKTPSLWYPDRRRILKYILFEYESHLCAQGAEMKIKWENVNDSTIEHILPQTLAEGSRWREDWTEEEIDKYRNDIGNLVLTHNNSNYSNKEFSDKKGAPGQGHCYSNSIVRQELKIAQYDRWTKETLEERRRELVDWVIERWKIEEGAPAKEGEPVLDINEDEDDED